MNSIPYIGVLFTLVIAVVSGCSRYVVSINENVVYTPPKLFSEYSIADESLKSCIQSTISESNISSADQLTKLICPPGNISNLIGIEQFPAIEYLGLSDNTIRDVGPLVALKDLKQIDISENMVVDFSVFESLDYLSLMDAKGNAEADCSTLLLTNDASIRLPKHCK